MLKELALTLAVLAAAALALPLGGAQPAACGDAPMLAGDAAGDPTIHAGVDAPATEAALDLRCVGIAETSGDVKVVIGIHGTWDEAAAPLAGNTGYEFRYVDGERLHVWRADRLVQADQVRFVATLSVHDAATGAELSREDIDVAAADDSLAMTAPRQALVDETETPAFPGRIWHEAVGISEHATYGATGSASEAVAEQGVPNDAGREHADRLPDDGWLDYRVQEGVGMAGALRMASASPFRLSNGEPTTMTYPLSLQAQDGVARSYTLRVVDSPANVDVWLPVDAVDLPGVGSVNLTVVATLAADHQHGGRVAWQVEARSNDTTASIEMGIQFTDIPQPTRHHPRLWLHERPIPVVDDGRPFVWATAAEAHTDAEPSDATYGSFTAPLDPRLAVGLDIATTGDGVFEVNAIPERDADQAALMGSVDHISADGNRTVLLRLNGTTAAVTAGESHPFTGRIEPTGVDRVAYEPGSQMEVNLRFAGTSVAQNLLGPVRYDLVSGWFDLPLDDYADDPQAFFDAVGALSFATVNQTRLVNPGEVALWNLTLQNDGAAREVRLRVQGLNDEWVTASPRLLTIERDGSHAVQVVVKAPAATTAGSAANFVVAAQVRDEPEASAVLHLIAAVVEDQDVEDQAAWVDQEPTIQQSPGPAMVAVLALLTAVAWRRRR